MPWNKLSSTTLTTTGDSIDSGTITASTFNTIIGHVISSSTDINRLSRFNGDTGNNYQNRYSSNGGSDATSTSGSTMFTNSTGPQYNEFGVAFFADVSGEEKMLISHALGDSTTTGAGEAPDRRDTISKWTGTADVTVVNGLNSDVGDLAAGSNVMIMGNEVTVDALATNLQVGSRYEETDTRKMYNLQGASTTTYETDFSSSTGWTTVGSNISITGGAITASSMTTQSENRIYYDLGSALSDQFVIEFDFEQTALSSGAHYMLLALTAGNGNINSSTNQDAIQVWVDMGSPTFYLRDKDGTTTGSNTSNLTISNSTRYYVTLVNNNRTVTYTVRTGSHTGTVVGTNNITLQSGTTGLSHVQSGSFSGNSGTASYTLDNLKIYDGITSITTSNTWQEIGA